MPAQRTLLLLAAAFVAAALAPPATATHVEPEPVAGPDNHTCADFAAGASWAELKVDPAEDGIYTDEAGELRFTVDVDAGRKTFAWIADVEVAAVFVKAGQEGHYLYRYDPAATSDSGLTTPGTGNQISHISFCYVVPCGVAGEPACPPTCEDQPTMPGCTPTCEEEPTMPECPPTCEDQPTMPGCTPTCEDEPTMPGCQECPVQVQALANGDGSVTVTVTSQVAFSLLREAGGNVVTIGTANATATWVDTTTEVGTTYTYKVIVDGSLCAEAQVTSIPNFPSLLATAGAVGCGVLAYALLRRRA